MAVSRRIFLTSAAASVTFALVPVSSLALELRDDVTAAIEGILDGRTPIENGITLDTPDVAENGAQVPVTITVDSPMTSDDHVTAIHVIATANPEPGIGRFTLTPHLAKAEVFTRIRLAEEQTVFVFAKLSDGRILQATARTEVTVGGCAT